MKGLRVDAVCYVLYVEMTLTVGNASIIRNIFYDKYASQHISTVLLSVASPGCTVRTLIEGRHSLLAIVKRVVNVSFFMFPIHNLLRFFVSLGAVQLLRLQLVF